MVDGFNCLGHYCIVGCNNYDCKVCDLGTSCAHGCEGFVSGGVEEGDLLSCR